MTARHACGGPGRRARAGFTLLEMLAVILIIAILIAIALPAFNAVLANARNATVRSEMAAINSAIADFKSKYNTEPPSRISFRTAAGGAPADPSALMPETKAILRKMFPQIDLTAASAVRASLTTAGLWGKELKGNEALVFFLGGVRKHDGTSLTDELVGFSRNPMNPFAQPAAGQSSRTGPFFPFDSGRLASNSNGQLVYRDSLSRLNPYIYASTAATGGYRDGATADKTDFPEISSGTFFKAYRKSATGPYWNPGSYQLISPGRDGEYGVGGVYDPGSTAGLNKFEVDNMTNFTSSTLGG